MSWSNIATRSTSTEIRPTSWQRYSARRIELMKDMHAGMHSSAAAVLSSSQLEQLDAMLNRELQREEAQVRMSKLESKIDNAAGAAPPN